MVASHSLSSLIYTERSIAVTAKAFAHVCDIHILEANSNSIEVEISGKDASDISFDVLTAEALNYMLDASMEQRLALL